MFSIKKIKLFAAAFSLLSFNVIADIIEIEINTISELRQHYEMLKLKKSAVFIDFDETIVRSVGVFNKTDYQFLSSPDLMRTYREISKEVLPEDYPSDYYLFKNQERLSVKKELLEGADTKDIVQEVIDRSAYVSVLSALRADYKKTEFLSEHWGVNERYDLKLPYNYGSDKAKHALDLVMEKFNTANPVENIVLIDNSYEFSLKKFKENIAKYIDCEIVKNNENLWLKDLNIIIVHYKYFGNELTTVKLQDEYDHFQVEYASFQEKALLERQRLSHSMPNVLIHAPKTVDPLPVPSFSKLKLFGIVEEDSRVLNTPPVNEGDSYVSYGGDEKCSGSGYHSDDADYILEEIDSELLKNTAYTPLRCSRDAIPVIEDDLRSSHEEVM